MKVVVCGGHHTSALIVAQKLKEKGHEVFWFGHKFSMIGDENFSAEFLEVSQKEIPFYEIKAGKFQRNYKFWQNLFRIPVGFWQSFWLLLKIKPKVVYSSGGYLALPVALDAFFLGIPVVTHEQTVVSGIANKIISKVAKKIFITFLSSADFFPKQKVVYTGLPVREGVFKKGKKLFYNENKTIYFTGGKQGAHIINEAVFKIVPELLKRFNIIHQCGSTSLFRDVEKAESVKKVLGQKGDNYLVKEYFLENEIGDVYRSADFVVSRAGAHTIYELMLLKKPAILIPIPWSNKNEQEENAKMLQRLGGAKILSQKELEKGKLFKTILEFSEELSKYKIKSVSDFPSFDSAEKIVSEMESIV